MPNLVRFYTTFVHILNRGLYIMEKEVKFVRHDHQSIARTKTDLMRQSKSTEN